MSKKLVKREITDAVDILKPNFSVVLLNGIIKTLAFDTDAVFHSFKLILQRQKLLVRF